MSRRARSSAVVFLLATLAVTAAVIGVGASLSGAKPAGGGLVDPSVPADRAARVAGNDSGVAPGDVFAGAVGVQRSDLRGAVEVRAFGLAIARANTDAEAAGILADRVADVDRRLSRLRERARGLEHARENGRIDAGRFRAEMARVTAEIRALERMADRSEAVAAELPPEALERRGIDPATVRSLRRAAGNATGPEDAALVRSVAGPSLDQATRRGPTVRPGPPGDRRGPPRNVSGAGRKGRNGNRGPRTDAGTDDGSSGGARERSDGNSTDGARP